MIFRYLDRLRHFTFTGFALRTDLIYGLMSLAGSVLINPANKPVSSLTTHDVGIYALVFAAIYLGIRALCVAPYYVWKEAHTNCVSLRAQVDSPTHIERQEFARLRAERKMEYIGKIRAAHMAAANHDRAAYSAAIDAAVNLHHQAIPDARLHQPMRDFMNACDKFIEAKETDYEYLVNLVEVVIFSVHGGEA